MSFMWPWMLLPALAGLVLLVLGYRRLSERQATRREELAALGLVVGDGAHRAGRARHLAPVLLLAALALMLVSLARPQATVAEPRREGTVILAFDVSTSMAATDLRPTRMEAAKAAARRFVEKQPSTIRIGVVAFGESGVVAQRPTTSRAEVLAAVDRLAPQGGTAVGRGILASLSAIAGRPVLADESPTEDALEGADIGYFGSAAIVLLSDGEDTSDLAPLPLAELASVAGVRIHPVGIGSPEGAVLEVDGFQVATALDEELLRAVADTTDGTYYPARDERSLDEVYASIRPGWTVQAQRREVTALFAAGAALLVLGASLLSVRRSGRVV
ncbi:VWA domain-containing protein [Knoellia sp. 3-2P3]|uniref:vWA domain-containing protein n=1 Tax=unclassified Knoellia TaxID=2618719 RepID=UPI0023DAD8B4|nr:VWA domain-containing protein [Knoellia sp. 3-2P3]MDF2090791.1 VWA domain-containing protein [Knoellia sp. 3-2P3]